MGPLQLLVMPIANVVLISSEIDTSAEVFGHCLIRKNDSVGMILVNGTSFEHL